MGLLTRLRGADSSCMNDAVYVSLISGLVSIAIAWIRRHDVREVPYRGVERSLDAAVPDEIWERYG